MNFLKRIANSAYVLRHCRWPSTKAIKVFGWVMALLGLLLTADQTTAIYHRAISTGAANPVTEALIAAGGTIFAWCILSGFFFVFWAIFFRMGTEIARGYRKFIAWAPGAWIRTRRNAAAVLRFVINIPSYIVAFFRAIGRGFVWLAGRPAWWRSLTGKEKGKVFSGMGTLTVIGTTWYLFFPVAQRISASMPSWMMMDDMPLLRALYVDVLLGSIICVFSVAILAVVVSMIARLFKH